MYQAGAKSYEKSCFEIVGALRKETLVRKLNPIQIAPFHNCRGCKTNLNTIFTTMIGIE